MNLSKISNEKLLSGARQAAREEKNATLAVIHHLREIESRGLHLRIGFSSLFEYAIKELGYSESSAQRRLQTMRLLKAVPEAEAKIASGEVTLTVAAQVQSFFQVEAREQKTSVEQVATPAQKLEMLDRLAGKSSREVEKELVRMNPQVVAKEKIRQVSYEQSELKLVIDEKLREDLERLKALRAHANPSMSYQELLRQLVKLGLEKWDPAREKKKRSAKPAPAVRPEIERVASLKARRIPKPMQRRIWQRDGACCSYRDPRSGRRCGSRHFLQVDHIEPFALGGGSTEENLRLLCAQHNRWRARETFPMGTVKGY